MQELATAPHQRAFEATFLEGGGEEKLLQLITNAMPALISYVDKDEKYLFNNQGYEQWFGQSAKETRGKTIKEIIGDEAYSKIEPHIKQALSGKTVSYETLAPYKDGGNRYITATYIPHIADDKKVLGFFALVVDITELKKNEEKIRENEERFRTMANEAPLFVWLTDEKLQTTYLNKNGFSYFNLDDSFELSALSWKKFIHPEDLPKVLATMHESATKHESYTVEMRLKNGATGEYRWFLDKGAPRYDKDKFIGFIGTSLDIHNRKEQEKELENKVKERTRELDQQNYLLKKQNNLVKKILDSSVDAIAVYDTETRIISINQASLRIFGGKQDEVIGKKVLDVVPQLKDSKGYKDLLRAINGETIHNEIYQSSVTGRYYENSLVPLRDGNDEIYAVLAVAHDNTDLITSAERLKVKNDELESTKSFLEQLIDSSVEFILVVDKDLRFITANRKYEEIMNLPRRDAQGKHLFEINPQVKATVQHESILRALNGETVYLDKRQGIARPEYFVDTYFIPLVVHDTVEGVIIMSRDVTDIVKSEQALQNKNRELNEAQQLALLGSWEWDPVNNQLNWSETLHGIYETEFSDGINFEKFTSLVHPDDRDLVEKMIQSAYTNKHFEEFFHRIITPSGKIKTLHARGEVLTKDGGSVIKMIGTGQDVTSQLQLAEQLEKLSESDQLKSDFIKMASHELKTPITSIKGYLQLLLTIMKEGEKHQLSPLLLKSSLVSIEKQVDKLTRLLSELLDLSRIESGQLQLNFEEFSMNELVVDAIQDVVYTQPKQVINLYHDHHSIVYADKDRITQVIINLLNNAVKYSPASDKIDVTIHRPQKNYISVSVRDYGIGIDKKNHDRVFERFYRAEGESEQTYPGFGIGLFIAREIIQRHNGSISLNSEKDKGSIFTFTLPVRPSI